MGIVQSLEQVMEFSDDGWRLNRCAVSSSINGSHGKVTSSCWLEAVGVNALAASLFVNSKEINISIAAPYLTAVPSATDNKEGPRIHLPGLRNGVVQPTKQSTPFFFYALTNNCVTPHSIGIPLSRALCAKQRPVDRSSRMPVAEPESPFD